MKRLKYNQIDGQNLIFTPKTSNKQWLHLQVKNDIICLETILDFVSDGIVCLFHRTVFFNTLERYADGDIFNLFLNRVRKNLESL